MATALSQIDYRKPRVGARCRVAIAGFGTVGSAVARLLQARYQEHGLRLTHVFNRNVARKKIGWTTADLVWTESLSQLLASDADVIVELLGGLEPAYELVREALQSGKSVVTANKQLMAHYGPQLLALARANGQYLGFGACVAGGVPVVSGVDDGLAGDRLVAIRGILNGTCNYILTRIEESGVCFADALREAQLAGFAESDPTADIDGHDAAAKLAILARVGLKIAVAPAQIVCRSIRDITPLDFAYARELGCTIRQISAAKRENGSASFSVGPWLVPHASALARVCGSQNLVATVGEFGGETTFGGHGAGGDPTAVAVVSDLIEGARGGWRRESPSPAVPVLAKCLADLEAPQYLRFVVRDRPGIIAALAGALAAEHINLDAVLQKPGHDKSALPFVITLERCRQSQLNVALAAIGGFDFLAEAPFVMPILR